MKIQEKMQNNFDGFLHGGDYNPEQWLKYPEILKKDIELFHAAHINSVSLGIFSWSFLEPMEGHYEFAWLEQIIGNLYENGIRVILATPSGGRPHWMTEKYPEVLRMDETRHRNLFGARHNHCYHSLVYREKTAQINQRLAETFACHPAVIMWHISNEFGGECHCPICQDAFRKWLKERYKTIEECNDRWCTSFWSHTYSSFEQVESPSVRGETSIQGLSLDWKRFVSASTADFIHHEVEALRLGGNTLPVTTNLMYDYSGLDYKVISKEIDMISWDSYPTWHREPETLTSLDTQMQHDLMRSFKKKPFLLMESCPGSTNWQPVSKAKKPGILKMASLQAVAHGSDSVCYFQLRQSRGAEEKFHGAVIDHYGEADTRVFKEVTKVGSALLQISEIAGAITNSKAAVYYDMENRWALEASKGPRNMGMHYKETVQKAYSGLRKQGINVDFVDSQSSLLEYSLVILPMVYLMTEGIAEKLEAYVKSGGLLVMTCWSSIVDENDRCYLGGVPHGLLDVMGLRNTEMDALYDWESNKMCLPESSNEFFKTVLLQEYACHNLCELVEVKHAVPLMVYGEDFYRGYPVLTRNDYGKGAAYYVATDAEASFWDDFCKAVVKEAFIKPLLSDLPDGVFITSRQSGDTNYYFVQNYLPTEAEILQLPEKWELIHGVSRLKLPGFETNIYRSVLEIN